jgi:tRNA(fMet)-specific endonuclease VapC
MIYLLDTNVLSRLARGVDLVISHKVRESLLNCRLSAVSWFELPYGASRLQDPGKAVPRLKLIRDAIPAVTAFDDAAAQRAAEVRAILETMKLNAQPIGPYDVLLAGHALAIGATLITPNPREFARVPGLVVADWQH